jgi:hypothetical protein
MQKILHLVVLNTKSLDFNSLNQNLLDSTVSNTKYFALEGARTPVSATWTVHDGYCGCAPAEGEQFLKTVPLLPSTSTSTDISRFSVLKNCGAF